MSLIANSSRNNAGLEWLPVFAGLLALYVPTFFYVARIGWDQYEWGHGPIILAAMVWLAWGRREALLASVERTAPFSGFTFLVFGLLMYLLGRVQGLIFFEVGALVPILTGAILAMRGWSALRLLWFVPVFAAFLVPPPGMYAAALTWPLQKSVSVVSEHILYAAGYPIALDGVTLSIGQYRLLVAEACAGLNSMFSLAALGLMYVCLMRHQSWLRNALILASVLPIAFFANVVRVIFLVLITYHFGDATGQGFLHGFSGIVLFVIALMSLILLDSGLGRIIKSRKPAR